MPPIDPERLRKAMEVRGVSAAELARMARVSPSYISRLLSPSNKRRGERSEDLRWRLAEALDVPVDWIEAHEWPSDEDPSPTLTRRTKITKLGYGKYDSKRRAEAKRIAREIGVTKAAAQLNIPPSTLSGWMERSR